MEIMNHGTVCCKNCEETVMPQVGIRTPHTLGKAALRVMLK